MGKITVVIFDDNEDIRKGLIQFLNFTPDILVLADYSNCLNAGEQILEWQPDVVLMDIDMPGANGIEGVRNIKKVSTETDIVMFTVFEDEDKIFEAMKAGASGYLLKKSTPQKIVDAIREVKFGGAPMTASIARKVVQFFNPVGRKSQTPAVNLSPRETEVLKLLVDGLSYKMIAAELGVSLETVRSHIKKIYEKLQVNSNTEAVSKALRDNLFG